MDPRIDALTGEAADPRQPFVCEIQRPRPGAIVVTTICPTNEREAVGNAWARRLASALESSLKQRLPVKWWVDSAGAEAVWIDVGPEPARVGRVRLQWNGSQLVIESTTAGIVQPKSIVARLFDVLGILAAIAGFVGWIWFVKEDWPRIWNRLSFSDTGDRASKLEVFLAAVGWFFGPVLAYLPIGMLGALVNAPLEKSATARLVKFARLELDPVIDAAVIDACSAMQSSAKARADLGMGRTI